MDGAKVAGHADQARAQACEERLAPLRRTTVREELQQQMQYHCNEIRRILDLKDTTPHAILESPAADMHRLVKAING